MKELQSNNFAVIDLGTNTFHLLIGQYQGDAINIIYKERKYVYLGKGGVDVISDESYKKGVLTLLYFNQIIENYQVSAVKVVGTSALRNAVNGDKFIGDILAKTSLKIEVIDGNQEADFIFQGVLINKELDFGRHLIMDIGGGSVEFIIFENREKIWAQSFKIGISILQAKFGNSDPLLAADLATIEDFLDKKLRPLFAQLKNGDIEFLIGASGSFGVLKLMSNFKEGQKVLDLKDFEETRIKIMGKSLEDRLKIANLPQARALLAPMAFHLMEFIIQKIAPKQIFVSPYAMKEGILKSLELDR